LADRDTAQDGRAGSDGGTAPDEGRNTRPVRFGLRSSVRRRARVLVVDERHIVSDEHVVLDRDALADERVARDLDVPPDPSAFLDLDERPDLRVVPDLAAIQVHEVENLDVLAELDVAKASLRVQTHSLTSLPRRLIDISAASRIRTTLRPAAPSVFGRRP